MCPSQSFGITPAAEGFPWEILGYPGDVLGMELLRDIRVIPAVLQPLVLWDGSSARGSLLLPALIQPCLEEWKGFGSVRSLWGRLRAPQFLQETLGEAQGSQFLQEPLWEAQGSLILSGNFGRGLGSLIPAGACSWGWIKPLQG